MLLLFIANICLGSSLVVYDAILCQIATPDERDRVSSRGWALGYLGGGLLLAVNKDINGQIAPRPDKSFAMYAYACLTAGATRMEEEKVVEVACLEAS